MEVKINVGKSKLSTVIIVKETLHCSFKEAKDAVTAGQFECPDELFDELNRHLHDKVGGFLVPTTYDISQPSEVNVKMMVESSVVVSEEWALFAKENPSLVRDVVMGLIESLKPHVCVQAHKEKDKFTHTVSIECTTSEEIDDVKNLAVLLNDVIVTSIDRVRIRQAKFKSAFTKWYYKEDEHES